MLKKIFALLILISIVGTLIFSNDFKAVDDVITTEDYEFDTQMGAIIKYIGDEGNDNIVIPNQINQVSVSVIKNGAFFMCEAKTITIPESITNIENGAFADCLILQEIIVSEDNTNFTSIDGVLFSKDGTVLVKYPDKKGDSSYDIPDNTIDIKQGAFERIEAIKKISIPSSLNITVGYFGSLMNLEEIIVYDTNPYLCSIDGVLFDKEIKKLIQYPRGKQNKEYIVPDSVECISQEAFIAAFNLENIIIPNTVREIGKSAFLGCNLNSIIIPENLSVLEENVFANTSIQEIVIPDNIFKIKSGAFTSSMIHSINIPNSVTSIDDNCFSMCIMLQEIVLSENIEEIKEGTFNNCNSLKTIVLPENITSIGNEAFLQCNSLETILIPKKVEKIGDKAFAYCTELKEITIPESVVQISENAFEKSYPYMVIKGKSGSYAESYAIENNIKFEDPEKPQTRQEDIEMPINESDSVNINDNSQPKLKLNSYWEFALLLIIIIVATLLLLKMRKTTKK